MTFPNNAVDPTAVGGKRIVAAFIDWMIGVAITAVTFLVLADSFPAGGGFGNACAFVDQPNVCLDLGDTVYVIEGSASLIYYGVGLAWALGIYIVMRGLTGKTPGTLMLGLVCINEQGKPPGIGKALIRSIAGIVDYIPCCFPLVGTITIFTTKKHQRVGDMAAKTYMIDKNYAGQPVGTAASVGPYATAAMPGQVAPQMQGMAPQPQAAPTEPQWDPQRQAWVQWDATGGRWMRFDDATQSWVGLD